MRNSGSGLGPRPRPSKIFPREMAGGKLAGHASFVRGETAILRRACIAFGFRSGAVGRAGRQGGNSRARAGDAHGCRQRGDALRGRIESRRAGHNCARNWRSTASIPVRSPPSLRRMRNPKRATKFRDCRTRARLAEGPLRIAKRSKHRSWSPAAMLRTSGREPRSARRRYRPRPVFDIARLTIDAAAELEIAPARLDGAAECDGALARPGRRSRTRHRSGGARNRDHLARHGARNQTHRGTRSRIAALAAATAPEPRTEAASANNPLASVPSIVPPDPAAPPIFIAPGPAVAGRATARERSADAARCRPCRRRRMSSRFRSIRRTRTRPDRAGARSSSPSPAVAR
jgi:hypothetical protein